MTKRFFKAILGLNAVSLCFGCVEAPVSVSPSESTREDAMASVVFDVYSGRENPRWNLTGDELEHLASRLESLSVAEGSCEVSRDRLGFRAIDVLGIDTSYGAMSDVTVYPEGSVAILLQDKPEVCLADPEHEVLKLILTGAKGHVDEPVLNEIWKEIE